MLCIGVAFEIDYIVARVRLLIIDLTTYYFRPSRLDYAPLTVVG